MAVKNFIIQARNRIPIEERFWKSVQKTDTCWIWTRKSKKHYGYGYLSIQGNQIRAHRLSWMLHFGDIPEGYCVCHHCDNPPCVRPEHLFLGTQADNCRDMQLKGRYDKVFRPKGERHFNAKLTEKDVIMIRTLHEQGISYKAISDRYDVTKENIAHIIKKRAWKHI